MKLRYAVDEQLSDLAGPILRNPMSFIADLEPSSGTTYISGGKEQPGIRYRSRRGALKTCCCKTTGNGNEPCNTPSVPTRDDRSLSSTIPGKTHGLQGQQKSFLALPLQASVLRKIKGVKPAFLLMIFSKLDDRRVAALMQLVHDDDRFGQVFHYRYAP